MTELDRLPPPFWRTQSFALTVMARPDRRMMDPIMVNSVLNTPTYREREQNGRVRHRGWIPELGHRLGVVILADGETVHNAMLDRDFEP